MAERGETRVWQPETMNETRQMLAPFCSLGPIQVRDTRFHKEDTLVSTPAETSLELNET